MQFTGSSDKLGGVYSVLSGSLSALALVGVAVGLLLQRQHLNAMITLGSRDHHLELLKLALEDPAYRECWGLRKLPFVQLTEQQYIYINLIFASWVRSMHVGVMSPKTVEVNAETLFADSTLAVEFWSLVRELPQAYKVEWPAFYAIVERAYANRPTTQPKVA